jgi:Fe-S cluster biogenesis protein NfuA
MGVLRTLLAALGLERPITPREPEPLSLTRGGEARLERLPPGIELVARAEPVEGGIVAAVDEAEPPGAPYIAVRDGLWVHPDHAPLLAGLRLDHDGRTWRVQVELRVGARETPNPDSRLYQVDRVLHRGRPSFFLADTPGLPRLAARLLDDPSVDSVLLRDHTLTVARRPGAPWAGVDRLVDGALHEHFLLGGRPLDGDAVAQRDDPLEAEVARVLEDEVLPGVHRDGGDIHLLRVRDGVAYVSLRGACASCPASVLTLKGAVERTLVQAFPGEVERVVAE